jgi:hypothetical protein
MVLCTSVLLVSAVFACAPIDGSTVACDIHVTTDAGTGHWCYEHYGLTPEEASNAQANCEAEAYPFGGSVGTVAGACPTDDVRATCSEALAAPDGEKTVYRFYLYGGPPSDAGPYELSTCPIFQ